MSDDTKTLESLDIMRILEYLPHRYPFLMVDRIIDIDGDNSAVGLKNVTFNEPFFQGHFPALPVMPGVLIVEGMAQTAGAICAAAHFVAGRSGVVYFMTIDEARFRRPVTPGDVLEYHVRKLRNRGNVWKFEGTAFVAGQRVAEARVGAMVADGITAT